MRVVFKKKPLERLVGQLTSSATQSRVQVGIFGGGVRADVGMTNAELGALHEKGSFSQNLPQRSFLKMPLENHLKPSLGVNWVSTIMDKGFVPALKKLGGIGEAVVQKAFATGGFGEWPALHRETIRRKGSSKILIDTSQMRRSITSRVV